MKNRLFLIPLIIVAMATTAAGQLTTEALRSAATTQKCGEIRQELDQAQLEGESMKFYGAICLYKNGQPERAMALFSEVRQMEAQRQHYASFWLAKCQAAMGQDSLAYASLASMPQGVLRYDMLLAEEFDNMAKGHEAFTRLKQKVAPGFNIWTGLLSAIAVLGLLIGIVLFFGKSRFSAGEKRLSVVVTAAALILVSYVTIWTGYSAHFPYLVNVWQFLTLLIGPSLYFYLKDTFKEDYTAVEATVHYIAPAFAGLLTLPVFLTAFGVQTGLSSDFFAIASSPTLLTGHLLFYAIRIYGMTQNEWQVDTNIKTWTQVVAWGMIAYSVAFLTYFILVRCSFFNPEWDYSISLVMALGILAIAYMGLVQRRVFSSEPIGHFIPVQKYQTSSLTESASLSIKRQMERLMREEQVFKENELRLADLAAYLDVSYHQLSQVINEHYGVNFFELINKYRVEHVKLLLADPAFSQHTIIQIAYEAGFNNKASFNRYFKKEIGMTPSAFRIKESSGSY